MTTSAQARRPSLARLFVGPRAGTTMIALGLLLATAAALLVISFGRRAAAQAAPSEVAVAYVVVATRDVAENVRVPADAVVVRPFPAAYLPEGAAGKLEHISGKYTTTRITRDQVLLTSQVSETPRGANIAAAIPPGKLAVWLPVPELTAQTGGLRPGDRVDLLVTLPLPTSGQTTQTTQLTLQNVELFFIGTAAGANANASTPASGNAGIGGRVAVVLLEPQDALAAKFVKDAGGTIDVALRSRDWPDEVTTNPVTLDTFVDEFGFRPTGPRTSGTAGR